MSRDAVSKPMQALYRGDRARAEELLAQSGELDVFEAAAFGKVERMRELLEDDAARARALSPDGFTALHFAAFFAHPAAARLLLDAGADARAVARNPMRVEPLHSAAAAGQTEIARMLLDAGADPNARQEGGFAPLHAAAQAGDAVLAELLLERGAEKAQAADDGRNAADFAREAGHESLVGRLTA